MLGRLFSEEEIPLHQLALITPSHSTTWIQIREEFNRITNVHAALGKRRIGLSLAPTATSYATLAALDKLKCDVFLFDAGIPFDAKLQLARKFRLGALLIPNVDGGQLGLEVHEMHDELASSRTSTVTILTSGTTGEPKAAQHTWDTLSRPVRRDLEKKAPRWLLTYRPNLYAGLQVMLQCYMNQGTLVAADPSLDPQTTAQFMSDTQVQFVSATPSYWRRLLLFADRNLVKKIPLVQITLGGEVIDQPILDQLRHYFPKARLVHIYATTELGRCFSVSDGLSGFPATYLDTTLPDGTMLSVRDGELMVRCLNAMRMYDPLSSEQQSPSDWFGTGDLAELRDGRVYLRGRRTEMINVGGSKVYPLEVERVIRPIPEVADVRVFGKVSSIAGELVACEVVPAPDCDRAKLKDDILRTCRAELASYQQPRSIKFVDRMDLSNAGKLLRNRTA